MTRVPSIRLHRVFFIFDFSFIQPFDNNIEHQIVNDSDRMERHVHNPEAQSTHKPHLRAGDQGIAYAESPVLLSHRTSVKF